jgi:hypothetical protein
MTTDFSAHFEEARLLLQPGDQPSISLRRCPHARSNEHRAYGLPAGQYLAEAAATDGCMREPHCGVSGLQRCYWPAVQRPAVNDGNWPAADSHERLLPGRLLHAAAAGFAPTEESTAASTKCRRLARDRRGHGSVSIVVRAALGRT